MRLHVDENEDQDGNRWILVIGGNWAIHDDIRKIQAGNSGEDFALQAVEKALFSATISESVQFEIDSTFRGRCQRQEGLALFESAVCADRPRAMALVDETEPSNAPA